MVPHIACCLLLVAMSTGFSQESDPKTITEAELLSKQLQEEIAEVEKQWAEEKERAKTAEKSRRERYSEFKGEKQRLEQDLAGLEREVAQTLAEIESLQRTEKEYQNRFERYRKGVHKSSLLMQEAMRTPFPFEVARRKKANDVLVEDLDGARIEGEEGVNRLYSRYQEEHQLARDAETYQGDLPSSKGAGQVGKFLRVGKRLMAYSSKDGSDLGFLSFADDGKSYHWISTDSLSYEERQSIRRAFAIADKSSPPGFVNFPFAGNTLVSVPSQTEESVEEAKANEVE